MKKSWLCFYFCLLTMASSSQDITRTYLALGDSYTIGEAVPSQQNFPHQTVALLQKSGIQFEAPVIVAKTGWTTDELEQGLAERNLQRSFDIVSLLIGVNNQYRGRSIDEYKTQFEALLLKAMAFAGGKATHVFVVSIPDWGVTPFAADRDSKKIAQEIDAFNAANKSVAEHYRVNYIEITAGSREASTDASLVASDGLHPSGKEYAKWSARLAAEVIKLFR